ncbi:hypothetical protein [Nocardiopsis sp. FIRDI 009]|uniref:hypothetical protein n=1 Tax=Nocardiopsis sp. FIRDI 009 TaxID=714197 RepID=UPI000E2891D8|nr:hypothetical protein [Nocardiopsis sp. FIRDI 009]
MEFLLLVAVVGVILWLMMKSPSGGDEGEGRLARKEFVTADGHRVGAGDRVWSQNHMPWLITRIGPMTGDERGDADIWAFMDFDPDYEVPNGLDDTLVMLSVDFPTYMHRRHPADGRCAAMGCGYRPWGAL